MTEMVMEKNTSMQGVGRYGTFSCVLPMKFKKGQDQICLLKLQDALTMGISIINKEHEKIKIIIIMAVISE